MADDDTGEKEESDGEPSPPPADDDTDADEQVDASEDEPDADADWFEQGVAELRGSGVDETATGDDGRDADDPAPGDSPDDEGPGSFEGADESEQAGDDDLFGESFADALADTGGPGAAGVPGEGAGDADGPPAEASFDDEDLDSDIPRISLGVEGLDEMIQGGVPERSLIVGMGGPGTGKTTFGLQFLNAGLEKGERGVFITLEENRDRVLSTATEKGWDFPRYTDRGDLAVVDLDPVEMANSLASIRTELPNLVDDFGASRLVLDSVSLLEMMYDDQAVRRTEVYDFTRALKQAGVTTYLTSEASADNPYASRHGIIEYLTDAVLVFRYVRPDDYQETRLAVEIQKIRDANHSRETKPYEITNEGINVYRQANIF
mgnify:CR=1 FL=1